MVKLRCGSARRILKAIYIKTRLGKGQIVRKIMITEEIQSAFEHVRDCPKCQQALHYQKVELNKGEAYPWHKGRKNEEE